MAEQGEVARGLLWMARAVREAPLGESDFERAARINLASWSRDVHALRFAWRHGDAVNSVAFSPDGRLVLTASGDRTARLWDTATGKPVGPPMEHRDLVVAAAFSPDGKLILTGCADHTARV